MNSAPPDIFDLAEQRLKWIDQRQAVLAENIANANTPGYAAKDITPFSEVLAAQARQAASGSAIGSGSRAGVDATATSRSINGNAVVLDEQLEKVAETDTAQQLAMNLYKSYNGLFRTAIGRN
jgi:flagellar basal-body rod protein FlgB